MSLAPKKSIRPKPRPAGLAEEAELRAMVNRANRAANREGADLPENMKKKSGGMVKKMADGGMCRGMGAAKRGGGYKKNG